MTERTTVEDVRRACGGDEQFASEVFELLEREGKAAQEEERAAIVERLFNLCSIEEAAELVRLCGYDQSDPGFCILAESVLERAALLIKRSCRLEDL